MLARIYVHGADLAEISRRHGRQGVAMLWGESAAVYCTTLLVLLLLLLRRDVLCCSRHVSVLFVSRCFSYTMNVQVCLHSHGHVSSGGREATPHRIHPYWQQRWSCTKSTCCYCCTAAALLLHCCCTAASLSAAALPLQGSYTAPAACNAARECGVTNWNPGVLPNRNYCN